MKIKKEVTIYLTYKTIIEVDNDKPTWREVNALVLDKAKTDIFNNIYPYYNDLEVGDVE